MKEPGNLMVFRMATGGVMMNGCGCDQDHLSATKGYLFAKVSPDLAFAVSALVCLPEIIEI